MPEKVGIFSHGRLEEARMSSKKTPADLGSQNQLITEARRHQAQQERTYRGQALKMYPWICARCGREFQGKKLRELTVHHKDHNHDNNPPDGSNWELLCVYCHDNEHQRYLDQRGLAAGNIDRASQATHTPFADLRSLLKKDG